MNEHAPNAIGAVAGAMLLALPFALWLLGLPA